MCRKSILWYKLLVLITALALLLPVLSACGGGDEEESPILTPTATTTATTTVTATPTPNQGPVKIGVESVWSGPAASAGFLGDQVLNVVYKKVKDMGGVLGGRELKIVKYDTAGTVAGASAGAMKLVKEDNVWALAWGGISAAEINAIASAAEELKVLYVPISSPAPGRLENELKYSVLCAPSSAANYVNKANFIINKLKPKTLAFLYNDDVELSKQIGQITERTEPAGIKTVYTGLVSLDAVDMTSYLTKIKYENPDVLVLGLYTPQTMTTAKQITELGGWGDIQVLGISGSDQAAKLQGSWGWIVETAWAGPDSKYPASVQFVEDYKAANGGKAPNVNHMWFYASLWTVIEAVKQAGTDDRAALAQFARSGNFQWDTPMGMAHFTTNGNSGIDFSYVRILEGGKT